MTDFKQQPPASEESVAPTADAAGSIPDGKRGSTPPAASHQEALTANLVALLRECYPVVGNQHYANLGTHMAKPGSLKRRIRDALDAADVAHSAGTCEEQKPAHRWARPIMRGADRQCSVCGCAESSQSAARACRGARFDASTEQPGVYPAGGRWMIVYDDVQVVAEHFTEEGAARSRLVQASSSWNCHLYARVATTARDTVALENRST
jgi:hypothetical protein